MGEGEGRLRHPRLPRERRRRLPARPPPRYHLRHLPPLRLAPAHGHFRTPPSFRIVRDVRKRQVTLLFGAKPAFTRTPPSDGRGV